MIKNIISGIIIGIANIIPGVSGGTIIVLLGLFDKTMNAISDIFSKKSKQRKENIIFLAQLIIGMGIGIVVFAKLLEILFEYIPTQTLFWFCGMILFSVPIFKKNEMKDMRISKIWFAIGILVIGLLFFFSPEKEDVVIHNFPSLNLYYSLTLIGLGAIGGGAMIFPGISGSMVLLVLGKYYLIKSYVANVLTFKIDILVPLCFIAVGIGLGIVISAMVINKLLKTQKRNTLSFILGLIIMSSIVIIPFDVKYNLLTLSTSIVVLLFGGAIAILFETMAKKKEQ